MGSVLTVDVALAAWDEAIRDWSFGFAQHVFRAVEIVLKPPSALGFAEVPREWYFGWDLVREDFWQWTESPGQLQDLIINSLIIGGGTRRVRLVTGGIPGRYTGPYSWSARRAFEQSVRAAVLPQNKARRKAALYTRDGRTVLDKRRLVRWPPR